MVAEGWHVFHVGGTLTHTQEIKYGLAQFLKKVPPAGVTASINGSVCFLATYRNRVHFSDACNSLYLDTGKNSPGYINRGADHVIEQFVFTCRPNTLVRSGASRVTKIRTNALDMVC